MDVAALERYLRDAGADLATAAALRGHRREHKLVNVIEDLENALAEARWLRDQAQVAEHGLPTPRQR